MHLLKRITDQYIHSCHDVVKLSAWLQQAAITQADIEPNPDTACNKALLQAIAHWHEQYTYCSIQKSTMEYILTFLSSVEVYIIYEHHIHGRILKELIGPQASGNTLISSYRTLYRKKKEAENKLLMLYRSYSIFTLTP